MYFYHAFGLTICSDLPLPELVRTAEAEIDVVIRLGKIDGSQLNRDREENYCHVTSAGALCFWQQVGAFWIQAGREITIDPAPGTDENVLRLLLLGAVVAVLLYQRGLLVLHASAVACNDATIAFVGAKGQGKSTMAASFHALGHSFVADDVVAVARNTSPEHQEKFTVLPSFPQCKLWPDTVASALGDDPERLPQLAAGYEKRACRIVNGFSQSALPLNCIYLLCEGPTPQIKQLAPQEALVHLIGHSYIARLSKQFLQNGDAVRHFHQCTKLVRHVPIYCLERPRSLALVPKLAELVEQHLLSIGRR